MYLGYHLLKNCYTAKYLGFVFQANGDLSHAMQVRMAQARGTFNKLHEIWRSEWLTVDTKLQIYESGVWSVLVYGSEVWRLTEGAMRTLRGWNARCLIRITGREVRDETRDPTRDLVDFIRAERLRWLGKILRMEEGRLIRRLVAQVQAPYPEGSIFMDAPTHGFDELVKYANDKERWNICVNAPRWRPGADAQ